MPSGERFGRPERLALATIVAGLAGTVAAMALPLAYPDMSPLVWRLILWPSLVLMVAAIVFLVGDLLVLLFRRGDSKPRKPKIQAIIGVLCLLAMFGTGGWYVISIPPPEPKPLPPVDGTNLQSRIGRYIFSCPILRTDDKRTREQAIADIKAILEARGDTFGLSMLLSEIPQGFKIEITPKTPEAAIRLKGLSKIAFEVRRAGDEVLVVTSMELPEPLGLLSRLLPIDPNSEASLKIRDIAEHLLGERKGSCAFL
jgi:hypothetical protein